MNDKAFQTAFRVTSWFECGDRPFTNPVGNFDGQGVSWGPRQTNFGQGSLQPLLLKAQETIPGLVMTAFGRLHPELTRVLAIQDRAEQMRAVASSMNDADGRLLPDWSTAFKTLGAQPAMQVIFMDDARGIMDRVESLAKWMDGDQASLRSYCLAYDFITQNGSVGLALRAALTAAKPILAPFSKDPKRDWLRVMAWARSAWTYIVGSKVWAMDVLSRKLLIIEGQGKFRGEMVDLDGRFGITDEACG
jgi:hypothetical protein